MHHREGERLRVFARRAVLLGGAQLGLFAALAGRLYYLQVLSADQYALLADENRINHRLLPPARGRIFDRHGVTLAQQRPDLPGLPDPRADRRASARRSTGSRA